MDSRRSDRGTTATEVAILLPLVILLVGGIVDYGRYFFTELQLTNAARQGARAGTEGADPIDRAVAAGGRTQGWQDPAAVGSCGTDPDGGVTVTTHAAFTFLFIDVLPGVPTATTLTSTATSDCS